MMTNRPKGVLYIGVTSNLKKRTWEHKNHVVPGFSAKYNLSQLAWFERHESMTEAITREKRIKEWKRSWKVELIEAQNPSWEDLYDTL